MPDEVATVAEALLVVGLGAPEADDEWLERDAPDDEEDDEEDGRAAALEADL